MGGPWEQYQQSPAEGPWNAYAAAASTGKPAPAPRDQPQDEPRSLMDIASKALLNATPFGVVAAVSDLRKIPALRDLSITGMARTAKEGILAPGEAYQGRYATAPETPGQWSDVDEARAQLNEAAMRADAGKLAGTLIMGQAPGGIFGAPRGSLASGFARPGQAPQPRPAAGGSVPPEPPQGGGMTPPQQPPAPPPGAPPPVGPPDAYYRPVVQAAERIGVDLPRYMVDEKRMIQGAAAGLQNIPGAGDRIAKAADTAFQGLGNAAQRVQEGFGAGSSAVGGSYAKDALVDWIKGRSGKVAERVYDAVDDKVNPEIRSPLTATARAAEAIMARRENAKIPGESGAVKAILDAATDPAGLNYAGIKDLRTFIGEKTPAELAAAGVSGAEVKQLYAALSYDLRNAAQAAGGEEGLKAFDRANRVFKQVSERREALTKIVGLNADAAPEAVVQKIAGMAGTKGGADIARLQLARKAMGPEAWNEVASAIVSRIGRDPKGEFSIDRFLGPNGYSGLSPSARSLLFNSTGKADLAKALDDIAFVSKSVEAKLRQFRNPSGTARSITATSWISDVVRHPVKGLTLLIGSRQMAKAMAEPATIKSMATWSRDLRQAVIAPHSNSSLRVRRAADELAGVLSAGGDLDAAVVAAQLQGINNAILSQSIFGRRQ